MTDSLKDLLGAKNFSEPDEIKIIKKFVQDNFKSDCNVGIGTKHVVINVRSASLAGALRLRLHELQALCPGGKRLSIRIG